MFHTQLNIDNGYKRLLEIIPSSIVLIDEEKKEVFSNNAYTKLPASLKNTIRNADPNNPPLSNLEETKDYDLKFLTKGKNFYSVVTRVNNKNTLNDYTLQTILKAMKETDNIYAATVKAISDCIGWRWASVTQFLEDGKVEVLALWDRDHLTENYIYEIAGTPCLLVAESERYTYYSDVDKVFSNNEMIQAMGAKTYAGLVYYGADNKPLGHIMAFHDERDIDYSYTKDVIDLACLTLSSHMLHNQTKESLIQVEKQANTDSLTGILNRKAFDDCLYNLQRADQNSVSETLLAIFDLDGLKAINDTNGHAEGDAYIKLFAKELAKLGRSNDLSFRIGGDEFAAVFYNTNPALLKVLRHRVTKAMQRIAVVMDQNVDVSVGFTLFSEAQGNVQRWAKIADERMYQDKNAK